MKKGIILLITIIAFNMKAQNVAINATGAVPVASAMLDVSSTNSGMLVPRMTTAQRNAIAAPAAGLLVYDTTFPGFWYFDGVIWRPLLSSTNGWMLTGNTLAGTEILGSLNAQPVRLFANNTERMRLTATGRFGFYTAAPSTYFHMVPPALISNFQSMWDNSFAGDAGGRMQNTNTANGSRGFLSVTNYNLSALQAAAVIGLALTSGGTGAIGVQGTCNGPGQTGVYAGNQNAINFTSGWGLYSNNWSGGLTAWQNVSDSRLKKDVLTIPNALAMVKNLRGVEYYFDLEKYDDINLPNNKQYGFIAQEVQEVLPEIVRDANIPGNQNRKADNGMTAENKTYNLKVLSYTYIIPLLVEGMKEQDKKIEQLEKDIEELKSLLKK